MRASSGAPGLVFAAALALYLRTLAPGLTWAHAGADGGDLLAAALSAGVPHPTGYPTYQLLLRAAIVLHPGEPARAGNVLSAVCMALAAAVLADLARRLLERVLPDARPWHAAPAAVAALAWAAAPAVWAQATITEVYALNALTAVLVLWLLWRGLDAVATRGSGAGWFTAAALLTGLGLGNHLTLALLFPGALAWLILHPREHGESRNGWSDDSRSRGFGRFRRLRERLGWPALLAPAAAFLLGLAVYAYLPVVAHRTPPVNWGDPSTPAGFAWLVTGRLYRPLVLGIAPGEWLPRLTALLREGGAQLGGPWGAIAALAGLWLLQHRAFALWLGTLLIVLAYAFYAVTYAATDSFVTLLPAWAVAALWLSIALGWTYARVAGKMGGRFDLAGAACLLIALLLMPGVALLRHWNANDLSRDRAAISFAAEILAGAEGGSVILVATDGPTFALWYERYGLRRRTDLVPVNVNLLGFSWYRAALLAHHGPVLAGMDLAAEPATWLPRLAAGTPVYRAEALGLETGLEEQGTGVLRRLAPAP